MYQNKTLIAITGGIGSGKTEVCNILSDLGEKCISCDKINSELLSTSAYLMGLKSIFPDAFQNGKLNKKVIKETITISEEKRKALNNYSHEKIKEILLEKINKSPENRIFVEVPILNQTNYDKLFDKIWIITAIKDKRTARIMYRDSIDEKFALAIIGTQNETYDYGTKTTIIYNNDSLENLKQTIIKLLSI